MGTTIELTMMIVYRNGRDDQISIARRPRISNLPPKYPSIAPTNDSNRVTNGQHEQRKCHRDIETIGEPGEHIARAVVGPEDVARARAMGRGSR